MQVRLKQILCDLSYMSNIKKNQSYRRGLSEARGEMGKDDDFLKSYIFFVSLEGWAFVIYYSV